MDAERKRQLKKLGKAEVQRQSAELRQALQQANPARPGSDGWAQGYKLGTQRERWLRKKLPTLHKEKLNELFVVRPSAGAGWVPHRGGYVQCMDCGSALPSMCRRSWFYFTGCQCRNISWLEFFWWRNVNVRRPQRVMPVKLTGRG